MSTDPGGDRAGPRGRLRSMSACFVTKAGRGPPAHTNAGCGESDFETAPKITCTLTRARPAPRGGTAHGARKAPDLGESHAHAHQAPQRRPRSRPGAVLRPPRLLDGRSDAHAGEIGRETCREKGC